MSLTLPPRSVITHGQTPAGAPATFQQPSPAAPAAAAPFAYPAGYQQPAGQQQLPGTPAAPPAAMPPPAIVQAPAEDALLMMDWDKAKPQGALPPFIAAGPEGCPVGSVAKHHVRILECAMGRTRPPNNQPFYSIKLHVLNTTCPAIHPPGTDTSWWIMMDNDAAAGNLLGFAVYATGWTQADIVPPGKAIQDPQSPGDPRTNCPPGWRRARGHLVEFCDKSQPLAGVELYVTCRKILLKDGVTEFTAVYAESVPGKTLRELMEAAQHPQAQQPVQAPPIQAPPGHPALQGPPTGTVPF